jgi:outer membrane lipoprotein-sorting protein
MRGTTRILALSLLAILAFVATAQAESSPEALAWLDKLKQAYQQSHRVDYTAEMNFEQGGQQLSMTMNGTTTQADREHMRMELDALMRMGEMEMKVRMLGVLDGETLWLESDSPMTGGKQVTRIPAEQAAALAQGGPGLAGGASGIDPVGQIEQLVQQFDFELAEIKDGRVVLSAQLTEEAAAELGRALAEGEGPDEFSLVLDEATAFPRTMRLGGEVPFMLLTFGDVEFLDPESLDPETFRYTPPEGVQVFDAGAVIRLDE